MSLWRRLGFSVFALCVAMMQTGVPVFAYARLAQESLLAQVICTPSGATRRISIDADGNFREIDAPPGLAEHCSLCGTGAAPPPSCRAAAAEHPACPGPIRRSGTWFQQEAATLTPPATGPPPLS